MKIITISRQKGSLGDETAAIVANRLGFTVVDRGKIEGLFAEHGISRKEVLKVVDRLPRATAKFQHDPRATIEAIHNDILDLAERENLVVVGQAGFVIFGESAACLHVRTIADWKIRVRRTMEKYGMKHDDAAAALKKSDRDRKRYLNELFRADWTDPANYDLVLNMHSLTPEQAADIIAETARIRGMFDAHEGPPQHESADAPPAAKPEIVFNPRDPGAPISFANESEEEFARILNLYQIRWEYEPKTFPLEWDAQGRPTTAFTPDFYLPDYDLFIELTVLKQKLVTAKNRKLRKLRELYPDVNIKIFYGKDYQYLLDKFAGK